MARVQDAMSAVFDDMDGVLDEVAAMASEALQANRSETTRLKGEIAEADKFIGNLTRLLADPEIEAGAKKAIARQLAEHEGKREELRQALGAVAVNPSALAGSLVHTVLETITKELVRAGASVQDRSAVAVLRALGGFSKVIATAIAHLMERLASNPRTANQIERIDRTLRAQSGELRVRIQTMLSRRQLPSHQKPRTQGSIGPRGRTALAFGAYCELECVFRASTGWAKSDMLMLTESACELTDFKTGDRAAEHGFQVITYALLWSRDSDLNPTGRRTSPGEHRRGQ